MANIQVTIDTVIFTIRNESLQVLLVKRGITPDKGKWSLPGGFIHDEEDQDLEQAALRILKSKTGVESPYMEQIASIGNRKRDPRNWSLTVVYFSLINSDSIQLISGTNTSDVSWFPIVKNKIKADLAFDHNHILQTVIDRLRSKTEYSALPVHLLPERFTFPELQHIYEIILGRPIDKSAFRRRISDANILVKVKGEFQSKGARPAQCYRLKSGIRQHFFPRTITSGIC